LEGTILDTVLVDETAAVSDVIFHLAAVVGVHNILDRPLDSLHTNLRGTEIVLEAAKKYGTLALLVSSSEIYGKNPKGRLSEEDDRLLGSPLKSRWSYAAAKGLNELLAYRYWLDYGLRVCIVRPFNVVGPRQTDRYGMVIPRFVEQALKGAPITVYGDGSQRRCFCSVFDIVPAMVALVTEERAFGKAVNLGNTEEVSVGELAERVVRIADSKSVVKYVSYGEVYDSGFEEISRRVPNITRAHDLIGFVPTVSLDEMIASVIAGQRNLGGWSRSW
ncbi:MAG TPA: NAD-dependent epimerase/dehydratase family protein, partial [Gammaproteobacteria bacterium]|nr:NAD-dependent epimerase/dehydratase family protein [Gammaproteobacteria bacterium]